MSSAQLLHQLLHRRVFVLGGGRLRVEGLQRPRGIADGSLSFDAPSCSLWARMAEPLSLLEIQKLPPR
jgi:hypothetical protein